MPEWINNVQCSFIVFPPSLLAASCSINNLVFSADICWVNTLKRWRDLEGPNQWKRRSVSLAKASGTKWSGWSRGTKIHIWYKTQNKTSSPFEDEYLFYSLLKFVLCWWVWMFSSASDGPYVVLGSAGCVSRHSDRREALWERSHQTSWPCVRVRLRHRAPHGSLRFASLLFPSYNIQVFLLKSFLLLYSWTHLTKLFSDVYKVKVMLCVLI